MNLETALSRYRDVHERILPSFVQSFTQQTIRQSYSKINPPLWILWHMARSEDFGINRLAHDGVQVFTKNNWRQRLTISSNRMGTGMSKEEVKNICEVVNIDELQSYRQEVYENNLKIVNQIQNEDLSTSHDDDYLHKILFEEDHLDRGITNILPVYQNKTREWFILHTLVAHNFYHIGQLSIIKQLLT